jgi:hypothetical protein
MMVRFSGLVVVLGCLAATGAPYALAAEDEKQPATATETATEQPGLPARQDPQPVRKPAATFTPTEKIGADSAVSFPVDI